jgi:hypothetical protein
VAAGAAVVATGLTLAFGVSSAGALPVAGHAKTTAPGDNGDVKIHSSTTPVTDPTDERNVPHLCVFYLDAFNFDSVQSVTWWIKAWPPTGDGSTIVDQGMITLDSSGNGFTTDQTLPNGHYKLFWTFAGEKGAAKHKVFWVSCPATPPTSPPTTPPTSPSCETSCGSSSSESPSSPPTSPSCETSCESSSESPSSPPSQTPSAPPPAAPAPTPVQTTLPVTG